MSFRHLLILFAVALCITAPPIHAKEERKSTVYNFIGKGSERTGEAEAKALYHDRFKVVDFTDERGYTRSKCTTRLIPRPVIDGGRSVTGYVRVVFVVSTDGHVVEPLVLRSTNRKLDKTVLEIISRWRGTSALLNGIPIAILLSQDFTFR